MTIASWLLPVLWRESDWCAALERIAAQLANVETKPGGPRAAVELGRAFEYVEPDRRRAIAAYELAGPHGDLGRARALAIELGWWSARARLSLAARAVDSDPRLVCEQAEAWWDAGQRDRCALVIAGIPSADLEDRVADLNVLLHGRDLLDHAASTVARAVATRGADAAEAYVMAARFSRAAGRLDDVVRWLEAALVAHPGHGVAASLLFTLAIETGEPERVQRSLRLRLDGLDATAWIDGMRTSALALIGSDRHRGFGLRLLRQALERAYESQYTNIPGHLAMWTALASHAQTDGARRELLPLVIDAIQASRYEVDRVWLGALATEIALRDAGNPVVAGAYAEIVAEYAPEHPIVRELITVVAATEPEQNISAPIAARRSASPAHDVPPAAVNAARVQREDSVDIDIDVDLDDLYMEATETALIDADLEEIVDDDVASNVFAPIPVLTAPSAKPGLIAADATPVAAAPSITNGTLASTAKPASIAAPTRASRDKLASFAVAKPASVPAATKPAALEKAASILTATAASTETPPSIARTERQAPIVPVSLAKAKPGLTTSSPKPIPSMKQAATIPLVTATSPTPSVPSVRISCPPAPGPGAVLAALRTVDRPRIPPRAPEPADASPRARRISIPIDVCLILTDGARILGCSRDLSTTGLFVLTDADLVVGSELTIELLLPGEEAFTEQEYRSRARIARRGEGGYGVELVLPEPSLIKALAAL